MLKIQRRSRFHRENLEKTWSVPYYFILDHVTAGFCALLVSLTFCCVAYADTNSPIPIPRATSLIVDQAKLLTDEQRMSIGTRLKKIQTTGRAQIGILIASGTGDETLAQYSLRVAEAWQLGRKDKDNGLLILIVPAKNAARIEVGYGLEGSIPDANASSFVNDYLSLSQSMGAAAGLSILLDKIVAALPPEVQQSKPYAKFLEQHPQWQVSLTLVVASLFTILPLLMKSSFLSFSDTRIADRSFAFPPLSVCIAAFISATLFATVYGFAAWSFWESNTAGYIVASIAFPLPLLWSLNVCSFERLGLIARCGLIAGNLCAFGWLFAVFTLFAGMGLYLGDVKELWAAPLFALLLASAPLAFILSGSAQKWFGLFLGNYMYFVLALVIAYLALQAIHKEPTALAFAAAAIFTALVAIGLFLDSRETNAKASANHATRRRWSVLFTTVAVLFLLPFLAVAIIHGLLGDEFYTRIALASAGDGSFAAVIWWAAGGLGGSALLIGLGGKFGGGGAGQ